FSTTKGRPKASPKSEASARARKSTEPPGGLVAMMRTGWAGQGVCATPASGRMKPRRTIAARPRMASIIPKPGEGPELSGARSALLPVRLVPVTLVPVELGRSRAGAVSGGSRFALAARSESEGQRKPQEQERETPHDRSFAATRVHRNIS